MSKELDKTLVKIDTILNELQERDSEYHWVVVISHGQTQAGSSMSASVAQFCAMISAATMAIAEDADNPQATAKAILTSANNATQQTYELQNGLKMECKGKTKAGREAAKALKKLLDTLVEDEDDDD